MKAAKKKTNPIEQTIAARILTMISNGCSEDRIRDFVVNACLVNKAARKKIIAKVSAINAGFVTDINQVPSHARQPTHPKESVSTKALNDAKRELEVRTSEGTWQRIKFGASLPSVVRDHIFSADEIALIKQVRCAAMRSGAVTVKLGCTTAHLNKLDGSGQLQHSFKRIININGKRVYARFWLAEDVDIFMRHGAPCFAP